MTTRTTAVAGAVTEKPQPSFKWWQIMRTTGRRCVGHGFQCYTFLIFTGISSWQVIVGLVIGG